jgi:hypothetical protein
VLLRLSRWRAPVALLTCALVLLYVVGCTYAVPPPAVRHHKTVEEKELREHPRTAISEDDRVVAIQLVSGERIEFNQRYGRYSQTVYRVQGTSIEGDSINVHISEVEQAEVSRVHGKSTLVVTLLVVAVTAASVLASWHD